MQFSFLWFAMNFYFLISPGTPISLDTRENSAICKRLSARYSMNVTPIEFGSPRSYFFEGFRYILEPRRKSRFCQSGLRTDTLTNDNHRRIIIAINSKFDHSARRQNVFNSEWKIWNFINKITNFSLMYLQIDTSIGKCFQNK